MTNTEALIEYARTIDQAAKMIRRATLEMETDGIPAPVVFDLSGSLGAAMFELDYALRYLANGLVMSLDTYLVHDSARPSHVSVDMSSNALLTGAKLAKGLGNSLSAAQAAVNGQTYTHRRPTIANEKLSKAEFRAAFERFLELREQGIAPGQALDMVSEEIGQVADGIAEPEGEQA